MFVHRAFTLIAIALCLLVAGCEPTGDVAKNVAPSDGTEASLRVTVTKPTKKTLVRRSEQPGQIVAFEQTPVFANVKGFISKVHVDIGDKVKGPKWDKKGTLTEQGTILAELSIPELDQELLQKEALVAQAESEVEQAAAAIKVAEALKKSAEALAAEAEASTDRANADFERYESELARIKELADQKAVTQKLVDEAQNQSRSADAVRKEVAAKITSSRSIIDEKVAGIEQARADLRAAQARLAVAKADEARLEALQKYTTLYAPFDGIVTERTVDTGHLVQPGQTSSDKPLFVVVQADTVRVFVDVPDTDATLVQPKSEATIRVPSLGGEEFKGQVTRTAFVLNPTTRTLRAEIDVPNADGKLRPGLYVYVDLKIAERKDALSLPKSAILSENNQSFCLCVVDGKIVRTPITVGIRAGDDVEIVSGLTGDEQVIATNVSAYREGQAVEVAPAK